MMPQGYYGSKTEPEQTSGDVFEDWWRRRSESDDAMAWAKANEYGSVDLRIMGSVMEQIGLAPAGKGQEAACAWYLLGKVARVLGILAEGKEPSNDTWKDITIYSMMGRRIRETGGWP